MLKFARKKQREMRVTSVGLIPTFASVRYSYLRIGSLARAGQVALFNTICFETAFFRI